MNLIFLGAPGSGKGTQAESLVNEFSLAHISTGEILRRAVSDRTALGIEAESYMSAGQLVPDTVVIGIIRDRLRQPDCGPGFLLDGFPRNVVQAESLSAMLQDLGRQIDRVIYLAVDEDELVRRLLSRGRADDVEETIRFRLKVYLEQTSPLISFYESLKLLYRVEGLGTVSEIGGRVRTGLSNP